MELDLFEQWWRLYKTGIAPRTMRQKGDCEKLWRSYRFTELQQKALMVKLDRQIEYRQLHRSNGNFVSALPDPIRYLRRKEWREEL